MHSGEESEMGKLSRRATMKGLAGVAGTGFFAVPYAARAETTWNLLLAIPVSTGAPARGAVKFAEDVEKATKGQLKIKVHLGGSLPIQLSTVTSAVSNNVVQLAEDIFQAGNVPIVLVTRLPMLIRNVKEFEDSQAILMPYVQDAYNKKGIEVLGQWRYAAQTLWSRKKLISLADIKGQKFRLQSPEQGELIVRNGGSVLTLNGPEVASALDRGLVDGVVTSSSGLGFMLRDLLKYNYVLPINFAEAYLIGNKEAVNAIPEEQRAALRKAAVEYGNWVTQALEAEEDSLRQKMKDAGMIVTPAQPQDVQEAQQQMAKYWESWPKTQASETAEALGKVRKSLDR